MRIPQCYVNATDGADRFMMLIEHVSPAVDGDILVGDFGAFDEVKVRSAVDERIAALNAKDFKRADEIRAALLAEGIQLMDSKNAAGERVTKWEIKR